MSELKGSVSLSVLGIVAEYNPFHNGHLYHLRQAVEAVKPEHTFIALSGCFTQRGDLSAFLPSTRAETALRAGADAVFEIPACWTLTDAGHYAAAAVGMLADLGVTHLAFGTEEKDPSLLCRLADFLDSGDPVLDSLLRTKLSGGAGYPSALSAAVSELHPEFAGLLNRPNNILALSYLRFIRKHCPQITPVFIRRVSDYSDTAVHADAPSATAVRSALLRGDWQSVRAAVPEFVYPLLKQDALDGCLIRPEAMSDVILWLLRTASPEAVSRLPDLSEGLENRIRGIAGRCETMSALLEGSASRRYPKARINRICARILLGSGNENVIPDRIPAAILLGIRKGTVLHSTNIGIIPKIADFRSNEAWFRYEILSYEAAALAAGLPSGLAFRQGVVTV